MCGLYYVKILKITELVYSQGKPFIYYIIGTRQTVILAFCLSLKRFRTSSHASVRYSNSNIKGACFNRFVCESVTLHDAAVSLHANCWTRRDAYERQSRGFALVRLCQVCARSPSMEVLENSRRLNVARI